MMHVKRCFGNHVTKNQHRKSFNGSQRITSPESDDEER